MKIKTQKNSAFRVFRSMRNYCGIIAVIALAVFVMSAPAKAATGVNEQIAYQGRLLDSTGAVVPDGTYNLEFKIYQDGTGCVASGSSPCGGTLKWTETRTTTNRVTVRNGYFSVQLGEVTAFGTNVDWNQSVLWLSVNVGGTATSPTWDGEMLPFRRIGASAYSLNSKQLGGLDASKYLQIAPAAVQADSSALSTIFLNKTNGTGNILQLQKSGADVLTVNNTGQLSLSTNIDVAGLYKIGGVSGASTTCSGGQFLQNQVVAGGIVTGGTCAAAGGGGSTLQTAYDNDAVGSDAVIALTSADDSFIVQNPASGGTDSGYTMLVEQLNTGAVDGLRIASAGTGLLLKVTDSTATAVDVFTIANEGASTFKNRTDSTAALSVLTSGSVPLFSVDTTNSRMYVGNPTPDTTGALLVLDTKNSAGDPSSAVDGAMYYNSDSDNFRCRHNGLWQDCDFASLRAEWVLREDFANTSTTSLSIGDQGWLFAGIGSGTISKTNVGSDASDQDRFGVLQLNSIATASTGAHLRLDSTGMAGVPSNMVTEFSFGPVNAAAAAGLQQIIRIGLHNSSTAIAPTNGLYFQYTTTTAAANWFRCTQTTCVDTGVARTTTANQYQRFKIQTNSAGTAVEFFINEVSVGVVTTNLPGATAAYGPAINASTVDATVRQWKIDYFQIKRNLTTLR